MTFCRTHSLPLSSQIARWCGAVLGRFSTRWFDLYGDQRLPAEGLLPLVFTPNFLCWRLASVARRISGDICCDLGAMDS